jgi:iron complex transport system substrate-binding protein
MHCKARLPHLLLAVLLASGLLAGACSSDDDDSTGAGGNTSTDDSAAADGGGSGSGGEASGTVTVEHRFGTTEVPVAPERIVSLDLQWTDTLAALGTPPVAYVQDPTLEDPPWQEGLLDDSEPIEVTATTTELPYEDIVAADPDLIVVTYFAEDQEAYELLSEIAPTIATLTAGDAVDPWQDITEVAGQVLGAEDEATALIDEVEGEIADTAAALPELEGQTFALVNYVPNDSIYVVADPEDGASLLFEQLGMEITPTILESGDVDGGRVQISFEEISLLDADLLLLLTNGADPEDISGYDALPAVESGAVLSMGYTDIVALNTPSALSVAYALELITPTLEAAADAA